MGDGLVGPRHAGRYRRTGHAVALEEIPQELGNRPEFVADLAEEGERAAPLEHPNCIAVYDLLRGDGRLYLVTELVRGRSVESLLAADPVMAPASALLIGLAVLDALAAAHAHDIVHGDVCAENVVITRVGDIKLGEFAIACALASDPRAIGWPAVAPPEGVDGHPQASDDVYAAAALIRRLLGGAEAPPAPHMEPVETVLSAALDPDPRRRKGSAAELRQALDAAMTESLGDDWRAGGDLPTRVRRVTGPAPARSRSAIRPIPAPLPAPAPPAALEAAAPPEPAAPAEPGVEEPAPPPERPAAASVVPPPARSRRRRWPLVVIALSVLLIAGVAAILVVNPGGISPLGPSNDGPLTIGPDAAVSVTPSAGGCDTAFAFEATGTVTGTGTLVFRWEHSDGSTAAEKSVNVGPEAGTFDFHDSWRIEGAQKVDGTVTFHILKPVDRAIVQHLTYSCG
jgi:hypothetical protein